MPRFSFSKLSLGFFSIFVLSFYIVQPLRTAGLGFDLFVIFLLFYSFHVDWKKAPLFACLIGITEDLFSTVPLGLHSFSLTVSTMILSYVLGKLDREVPFIVVLVSFLFSLLAGTLEAALYAWIRSDSTRFLLLWPRVLVESIWLGALVLPAFSLLDRWLGKEQKAGVRP